MIILDTNVISEVMRHQPDDKVLTWLNGQSISNLFVTSISMAEISFGLQRMPEGKRKQQLIISFNQLRETFFINHTLAFTDKQADIYGELRAKREKLGKPISHADAQIAAISLSYELSLATRNTKDFIYCDIKLINPFD